MGVWSGGRLREATLRGQGAKYIGEATEPALRRNAQFTRYVEPSEIGWEGTIVRRDAGRRAPAA